jgi:hypothetical protein
MPEPENVAYIFVALDVFMAETHKEITRTGS